MCVYNQRPHIDKINNLIYNVLLLLYSLYSHMYVLYLHTAGTAPRTLFESSALSARFHNICIMNFYVRNYLLILLLNKYAKYIFNVLLFKNNIIFFQMLGRFLLELY